MPRAACDAVYDSKQFQACSLCQEVSNSASSAAQQPSNALKEPASSPRPKSQAATRPPPSYDSVIRSPGSSKVASPLSSKVSSPKSSRVASPRGSGKFQAFRSDDEDETQQSHASVARHAASRKPQRSSSVEKVQAQLIILQPCFCKLLGRSDLIDYFLMSLEFSSRHQICLPMPSEWHRDQ